MPTDAFEDGVEAGLEGKSRDDNPYKSGVIDSVINAIINVSSATRLNPSEQFEEAASQWEAGRQEGIRLRRERES